MTPDYDKSLTFDIETSYGTYNNRVGSRWSEKCRLCSIGVKTKEYYNGVYYVTDEGDKGMQGVQAGSVDFPDIAQDIEVLVGHNIKFDLLWYWDSERIQDFFRRGGVIWDTQYAEYLLSGQFYNSRDVSLKKSCKRRELGNQKLDIVAELWDKGVRTEDIPERTLMEYLKMDVLSTEELYATQVEQAKKQGQLTSIQGRMEGLLGTTEIEYNGLCIDLEIAKKQQAELERDIIQSKQRLEEWIPKDLPYGCAFKFSSPQNVSALLFGGDLKYRHKVPVLDTRGNQVYYKKNFRVPALDAQGNKQYYKGGKRKGELKTKLISGDDLSRPKTRLENTVHTLPRLLTPNPEWLSESTGYYSTNEENLSSLKHALIKDLLGLKKKEKDLGTYYYKKTKSGAKGMLTCVQDDGLIHGHLNHTVTVTGRLSSTRPNLQNIPKGGKSDVKKVFTSRFKEGIIAEIDYSQLEVVTRAVLSKDPALLNALENGVDFHSDWLALAEGKSYEYVKARVDAGDAVWIKKRSNIKPFTFG